MFMDFSRNFAAATLISMLAFSPALAGIDVSVDVKAGVLPISPYLYGRNIDKVNDGSAESDSAEQEFIGQVREAGIHMMRANNGNNATRYNWRKKLTVHPDWFNNVYSHDWAITAKKVLDKMPGVDAMYAFQLTGYAASSTDYNFPDWNWKQEHGSYPSRAFDLAGGGEVSEDGETLVKAGDYTLYNEEWPADSTVGIVPYWRDELKFDMSRFQYWSMDNEMEIWRGTHSDLDLPVTGDFLVERYIDVAKKARTAWKDIKLTGPVVANEWQWCHISAYNDESRPKIDGQEYCWLEFFTKKIAEAEKTSGMKLLDVFDIHWYPSEKDYESRMNWHRVLFDTTYYYKGGNGIRCATGKCDWSDKEKGYRSYIFVRINRWLEQYFGKDHGIKLALTETSLIDEDPMVTALTYASFIGTMQDNGVAIFTPWSWGDGMYETVHLFSRYGHANRVQSVSTNDSLVSAYSSITAKGDSLTVIFVNRAEKDAQDVQLKLANFDADLKFKTLTLQNLKGETFVSHTDNALEENVVNASVAGGETTATSASADMIKMTLPPKSITALLLASDKPEVAIPARKVSLGDLLRYEGGEWLIDSRSGEVLGAAVFNSLGQNVLQVNSPARAIIRIAGENLGSGNFIVRIKTANGIQMKKLELK